MTRYAWLTGDTIPENQFICRLLRIPNELYFIANVNGALLNLCERENWEQFGTATVDETVAAMNIMYDIYSEGTVCMIGSLLLFATGSTPQNTLLCDGASHLKADYPRLYDVLDSQYIVDSSTFITPQPVSHIGLDWYIVAK